MELFDALPGIVRAALRQTVHEWTAEAAANALKQGHSADFVAAFIIRHDLSYMLQTTAFEWSPIRIQLP